MIDYHLREAEQNLNLLDEQVGKPSVPTMPQTTNQAIVLVLKDLVQALRYIQLKLDEDS